MNDSLPAAANDAGVTDPDTLELFTQLQTVFEGKNVADVLGACLMSVEAGCMGSEHRDQLVPTMAIHLRGLADHLEAQIARKH